MALVDLNPYVDDIRTRLIAAAEAGGDEARSVAQRLVDPLDAALRLALQDALVAAADELTLELAPASVELRVRGRELEFAFHAPAPAAPGEVEERETEADDGAGEGATARINVRMPEQLKARVERAAANERRSVNAWLVQAATNALDRDNRDDASDRGRRGARGAGRYTGWVK